jgi:hypothetical protein
MKKSILLLALTSILFSTVTVADYKINITSPVLNQKTTFGEVVPSLPDLVPLDETGEFGNIALIGSNGITESSITSDTLRYAGQDAQPMSNIINGVLSNGNGWANFIRGTPSGSFNKQITIDLGKPSSISGFRVISFNGTRTGFGLKDIRIESSNDGINFTTEEFLTLPDLADSGVVNLTNDFTSRYFRIFILNGYGTYILIGILEVYQTQP